jgi:hypothetical protein
MNTYKTTIHSLINCFFIYNHNNYFAHLKNTNIQIIIMRGVTITPKTYCRHNSFCLAFFKSYSSFNLVACALMLCPSMILANCKPICIVSSATLFYFFVDHFHFSIYPIVLSTGPSLPSIAFLCSSDFLFSSLVKFNSSKISRFSSRQC